MRQLLYAGLMLATAFGLAACDNSPKSKQESDKKEAAAPSGGDAASGGGTIKIAVGGPLTGPNAAFGAQLKNGADQAAQDINAAGGILGKRIELVFGDDVSDPKQGVSVANSFAGEAAKFVVGHFNSGVSIPSSDVYAENGMLQITPASTNPTFTERNMWNVFRTCGRDDQQGLVAGKFLAEKFAGKKAERIAAAKPEVEAEAEVSA